MQRRRNVYIKLVLTGSVAVLLCLVLVAPAFAQRPSLGGLQQQINQNSADIDTAQSTGEGAQDAADAAQSAADEAKDTADAAQGTADGAQANTDTNSAHICTLACTIGASMNIPGCVCPPTVDSPIVAETTNVRGTGIAGATVDIFVDGGAAGSAVVAPNTAWNSTVPPLVENEVVTATQTDGGFTSALSNAVTVDPAPVAKTVFVTSSIHDGNLGGLTGADAICQSLADGANLSGTYLAWLSDSTESPNTRFVQSSFFYELVDHTLIAFDYAELVGGGPRDPINVDEDGQRVTRGLVWTGTDAAGNPDLFNRTCGEWGTNVGAFGATGDLDSTSPTWTFSASADESCEILNRLYCFEQ